MKSMIKATVFLLPFLASSSLAQSTGQELSRVISAQQAQIAELKSHLNDMRNQYDKLSDIQKSQGTDISAAQTAAKNAKTAADAAQNAANSAQVAADNAQKAASGNLQFKGFWHQTGNYSNCNALCSSQGMRCVTGQAGTVALSNAVSCAVETNVCICVTF